MNTIATKKHCLAWICNHCTTECFPIRTESRCICGHRLKEHGDVSLGATSCKSSRCSCKSFFYIVAEGAWVLRCRCKHKHIEHDPITHKCIKTGCKLCHKFDSPWVCNCNHPWSEHTQHKIERVAKTLEELAGLAPQEAYSDVAPEVNNYDMIKRGDF